MPRLRILYHRRAHPKYQIGGVYPMPDDLAQEYLAMGAGEIVGPGSVEVAVAPPPEEMKVEVKPPVWPLKTKTPVEYVAEWGDADPDELSPSVAENLAIARAILQG